MANSALGPGYCDSCRFWGRERAHDYNRPYGRCLVRPPSFGEGMVLPYHDPDRPEAAGPYIRRGEWPWTAFDDRCGEWQAKPA